METFDFTNDEHFRRLFEKLHYNLGNEILKLLEDKKISEIMVNTDGNLWIDHVDSGQMCVGFFSKEKAFSLINSVAGINNRVVSTNNPKIEAKLPFYSSMNGERFVGQIPPIVSSPCFSIRKSTEIVFDLEDYVNSERMSEDQLRNIRELIYFRKNIVICGGPGSGKTSFLNSLIVEALKNDENQRFLILEDIPEIKCSAKNMVSMLTSEHVDMTCLLRLAMRMRPDRILIGEVTGKEALNMLKAWNTGCPGGFCTIHANGAKECIQRILDLAMESGLASPPKKLLLHTVDSIISIVRTGSKNGFVSELINLSEYKNDF